jgi:hypothetical protein
VQRTVALDNPTDMTIHQIVARKMDPQSNRIWLLLLFATRVAENILKVIFEPKAEAIDIGESI